MKLFTNITIKEELITIPFSVDLKDLLENYVLESRMPFLAILIPLDS